MKEVKVGKTPCGTRPAETRNIRVSTDRRIENREEREGGVTRAGSSRDDSGALWEGEYDEKASAQSFQEALAEWRAGHAGKCQILSAVL